MQSKFSFNIFVQCHQKRVDYEDRAEMKVGGMRVTAAYEIVRDVSCGASDACSALCLVGVKWTFHE